ncbi:hypothetical protein AXA44_09315 [Rhodococcus sp. SC4]|nr:hypothetical protein AXA44_09315 [Rhodococcus sp. SC4]
MAKTIASASAMTLSTGNYAFYRQIDLTEDDAYHAMQEVMAVNAVTYDSATGQPGHVEPTYSRPEPAIEAPRSRGSA